MQDLPAVAGAEILVPVHQHVFEGIGAAQDHCLAAEHADFVYRAVSFQHSLVQGEGIFDEGKGMAEYGQPQMAGDMVQFARRRPRLDGFA